MKPLQFCIIDIAKSGINSIERINIYVEGDLKIIITSIKYVFELVKVAIESDTILL